MRDPDFLDWLRYQRSAVPVLASVGDGALVLAAAGVLAGRAATTSPHSTDALRNLDDSISVRPEARFVDDGNVLTSAGADAAIDLALHLVVRLAGTSTARDVRQALQYDPRLASELV